MPQPIDIRSVTVEDMPAVTLVMTALGFDHSPDEMARRWQSIRDHNSNPRRLAFAEGQPVGLIALHLAPLLFYPTPVARITTLAVLPAFRRKGVGRALIADAVALACAAARSDTRQPGTQRTALPQNRSIRNTPAQAKPMARPSQMPMPPSPKVKPSR